VKVKGSHGLDFRGVIVHKPLSCLRSALNPILELFLLKVAKRKTIANPFASFAVEKAQILELISVSMEN
jgi:hypothetical protein